MRAVLQASGSMRKLRLRVVEAAVLCCFGGIGARAYQVQVVSGARLRDLAEDRYLQELELSAPRGDIYDRAGRTLAVSVGVESIYIDPGRFDQANAAKLGTALGLSKAQVLSRIDGRRAFAWIMRRVTPRQAEAVRGLDLAGVHFTKESKRFYPNRELAAHLLGFVGVDGKGLAGVELRFDDQLRGRTVDVSALRDARGRPLSTRPIAPVGALEGDDLHLTIDSAIQQLTEDVLAETLASQRAAAASAVVLDPLTGAVLAMATLPTYNPNDVGKSKASTRRIRPVTDVYEPGSTLKPMVIGAAIEQGLVKAGERIFCENGSITVGRHVIRDSHAYGELVLADVLAKSSNIGALKVGSRFGAEKLHRVLTGFGFGAKTGIEVPGEVQGLLATPERWSKARLATISFGQGIGVTAIQLAAAVGAIASGGMWRSPYLVEKIVSQNGDERWVHRADQPRRVLSLKTTQQLIAMMERVVSPEGTGGLAAIPGVRVAGKTGTAQKVDPVVGGYSADKHIASFVGFAPAEAPRALVLVVVDEPQESCSGGIVAAPAFKEIMTGTLSQLGVSVADANVAAGAPTAPPPAEAVASSAAASRHPEELGAIQVRSAYGVSPSFVEGLMPDLRGLDMRRAASAALSTGLEVRLEGQGTVVEQRPTPGTPLRASQEVWLKLSAEAI